jgi:hypothetical protein
MNVTLSVVTRPRPGTWTTQVVVILIVIVVYRWAGPGWALPLGLGGWLASHAPGRAPLAIGGEA